MPSTRQLGLLYVAKAKLGIADDDYRAMLSRVAGVESAKHLSDDGFAAVMAEFERLGFVSAKPRYSHRDGFASPSQLAFIKDLWRDYRGEDDEAGFRQWLERFHHVSDARFITVAKAQAVVTALKAMARRKRAA
ncbi:MAG: regulatory protein GemA [Rhizobiales bacterium]|nr:regulatory protein GemA [Hyphomicrobiales bacterium]